MLRFLKNILNIYEGPAIKPRKGDCSLYWSHIKENICNNDPDIYGFLRKWLAHMFQFPEILPGTAIVISSLQGTGKGVFVSALLKLWGHLHSIELTSEHQICGNFNSQLWGRALVHCSEGVFAGNRASQNKIKAMITDPSIPIERKGQDIFVARNFSRFIFTGNHQNLVAAEADDRRFLFLEAAATQKENHGYFAALVKQLENGGHEALMFDLMNEDLSNFNPHQLPKTSGVTFEVKIESAPCFHKFIFEFLNREFEVTEDIELKTPLTISKEKIYDLYAAFASSQRTYRVEIKSVFFRQLNKFFPNMLKTSRKKRIFNPNEVNEKFEPVRNNEVTEKRIPCIEFPPLYVLRPVFEQAFKADASIWEETEL